MKEALFFTLALFAPFTDQDRLLIVTPHPDDEVLATGGLIQQARSEGAAVKLLYLTRGDHNEISSVFYRKRPLVTRKDFIRSGEVRKAEALNALGELGITENETVFLGYPDFGLLRIWLRHWGQGPSYRSLFSRLDKVPYFNDFSYGRPYKGESIVEDLEKILLSYRPTHIFVTAPFDLNADHRAAYLFLNIALLNLRGQLEPPKAHLYLIHAKRWPKPKKFSPAAFSEPPPLFRQKPLLHWIEIRLNPSQVEKKMAALSKYKTQTAYKKNFLHSFVRTNELFAELPHEKLKRSFEGTASRDVHFWVSEDEFWIRVNLRGVLDERGALGLTVFPYGKETPFSSMPKLSLRLLGKRLFAKDRGRDIFRRILYSLDGNRVYIRIPMKILKNPETIFVSAESSRMGTTLDFGSWRILEV